MAAEQNERRPTGSWRASCRLLCGCIVVAAFLGVLPSQSQAAAQPIRCPQVDPDEADFFEVPRELVRRLIQKSQCTLVRVPLDYAGRAPGTIDLFVRRVPAAGTSRGAIVALAGGPGQAATPLTLQFAAVLAPVLRDRDLIILDQRGTGRSGALPCSTLEKAQVGPLGPAVQACAAALGPRRAFYTTLDSADDIEAMRRALGIERLSLFGTSYGTKVALAYAQRYPEHVERLLLDSVVPIDGPDPFERDVFRAVPRVLRTLCAGGACRAATPDPVGDLAALVKRLGATPLRGYLVGADGRRRARRLGRLRLFRILVEGDLDPSLRAEFPADVRAALRGDAAPLLRLAHRSAPPGAISVPRAVFSPALFVATVCEEGPLPWELVDPFSNRWGKAIARAGSITDADFFPFDRATGRASDTLRLCAHWPANGPTRRLEVGPLPDIPALLLSGEEDLRTPSEGDERVADLLPHATDLTVPSVGHAVLINDSSGCSANALRRFFADQPIAPICPQQRPKGFADLFAGQFVKEISAPTALPPASLADVPPPSGVPGRAGRTLKAVKLTLADYETQAFFSFVEFLSGRFHGFGGLRGGRFGRVHSRAGFVRYSYVPGVEISGLLPPPPSLNRIERALKKLDLEHPERFRRAFRSLFPPVRLRVTGKDAARGRLAWDVLGRTISGRLGGRRVRAKLGLTERLAGPEVPPLAAAAERCCQFVR
jgi:pimeloyl-ACP methyl ester carboxylesterase